MTTPQNPCGTSSPSVAPRTRRAAQDVTGEPVEFVILHDSAASQKRGERLLHRLSSGLGSDFPVRHRSCRVSASTPSSAMLDANEWVRTAAVTIVALAEPVDQFSGLQSYIETWLPAMALQPTALVFLHVLDEMKSMHSVSSTLERIATARGISYFSSAVPRVAAQTSPARRH